MKKPVSTKLRRRAESKANDPQARLVHELEVRQVELELQTEELRDARLATENVLERYRELFDFAPIGYVTLGEGATIREINHAGAGLLGHARAFLLGKRFVTFIAAGSLGTFEILQRSCRQGPTSRELELEGGRSSLWVRVTAVAMQSEPLTIMLAFEDISSRKAQQAELARSEQALRDMNRRKDEFLAMLSHELRNPLSPIRTCVSILQLAPRDSEAATDAIKIIDRSSAHLTRLVDDLLDVTRITLGKIELKREPVELGKLVQDALDDHRNELAQLGLAVETRFERGELWVDGDRARLVQIVTNLLSNAEKFTPKGGSVKITLESASGHAMLRVVDTGVGIDEEVIDRLFEPFAQGPQSLDRSRGGLGLGLAMVRSLVALHRGRVSIRSAGVGKGTEAMIALPLVRPPVAASPDRVRPARSRRVLIIEDKVDTAESLRLSLAMRGHDVRAAYDGRNGVELAVTFAPEIVLCDIGLPDIDGYAVARTLRSHATLGGVYLVALTGYAQPDDIARARESGFDLHVAKPASIEELELVLAHAPSSS